LIISYIARRHSDRIDERKWGVGTGRWVAELRIQRDAIGALWGDGENAANIFPDAMGGKCVFLEERVLVTGRRVGEERR